jgi:hypothetical protein
VRCKLRGWSERPREPLSCWANGPERPLLGRRSLGDQGPSTFPGFPGTPVGQVQGWVWVDQTQSSVHLTLSN